MSGAPWQGRLGVAAAARLPVPERPTWFDFASGQTNVQTFRDLDELARHVAEIIAGRTLRLAVARSTIAVPGFELFPAWSLYATDAVGSTEWLGQAAVQDMPRDQLQAGLDTATAIGRRAAA